MSEEELIKDIKETKYNEENVEKLLYELENDTGNYSWYDNAIAIIYYKDLYQKEKEKNKTLEILLHGNLYEMYLYYKELASRYQANSVSKDEIREILNNTEKNIEEDRPTIVLESLILNIKELLGE